MQPNIEFDAVFVTGEGEKSERARVTKVVIGGWTGRDAEALRHHIEELAKIGVTPPEKTPLFYRVGVSRLSVADAIEVIGDGSSGEVEYVMLKHRGRIWVGVGSDHTDRVYEKVGITLAKQLCDKPIANRFWPLSEVESHWDQLQIRSYLIDGSASTLYQDGKVLGLLSPQELLDQWEREAGPFGEGTLMFGGTCGAIGGVRFGKRFAIELIDPVRERSIRHEYDVIPVPIRG